MIPYLWVAAGSALGRMARYGLGILSTRMWGQSFPWGTIAINVLGSFVISFFGTLTIPDGLVPASPNLRVFVMVGICGGFTTSSSLSLQTLDLARGGEWLGAAGNVGLSLLACLIAVTAGHVSAAALSSYRSEASAMSAHIIAVLDRLEAAHPILAAAALAAQRLGDQRLEVLHIRHDPMEGFMPTEEVMTEARRQEVLDESDRRSSDLRKAFDTWRRDTGIGTWREVTGPTGHVLTSEAQGADLLVIGHAHASGEAGQALHTALSGARSATLLVPEHAPVTLGSHIVIAWKASEQAERAVEASMKLLASADQVWILTEADDSNADIKPDSLVGRLETSGVSASVECFRTGGREIGQAILDETKRLGADLLIMGAYSHPRLIEFLLGGATRQILRDAGLPVLLHA